MRYGVRSLEPSLQQQSDDESTASLLWHRRVPDPVLVSQGAGERTFFTSNYVLVESFAPVQRRLGLDALRGLAGILVLLLQPLWIDEELHAAALAGR